MKKNGFKSFKEQMPKENRWVLVTNNLNAKHAFGEMSHLWLTNFVQKKTGSEDELICFSRGGGMVRNLTHWKYAL